MGKIVKLTEGDLIHLINRVLSERKLNEDDTQKENLNTKNIVSDLSNLSSVNDINNYFKTFDTPEKEKLVLIFPGYGQYTVVSTLLYLTDARVFTSINDCISVINSLASRGKKYNEIYIGSHGGGSEGLLHSIDDGYGSSLFNGFSDSLSKIVIPGSTKVLFSACSGADDSGFFMKKFAERTNTYVYASEGDYDWIMNTSEKGFWVCPPTPKLEDMGFSTKKYNKCKRVNSSPFSWL
jgi:hypothetical protein